MAIFLVVILMLHILQYYFAILMLHISIAFYPRYTKVFSTTKFFSIRILHKNKYQ